MTHPFEHIPLLLHLKPQYNMTFMNKQCLLIWKKMFIMSNTHLLKINVSNAALLHKLCICAVLNETQNCSNWFLKMKVLYFFTKCQIWNLKMTLLCLTISKSHGPSVFNFTRQFECPCQTKYIGDDYLF